MKHMIAAITLALGLFTASHTAHALEVGDSPSCVDLNQLSPNGGEAEHCLLETKPAGQPVLLDFFSVSCHFCVENLPQLTKYSDDSAGKLTVRVVGIDRDEQAMRAYFNDNRDLFHFEFALDSQRAAKAVYGVNATPTYFLLDGKGKIIFKQVGELSTEDFAKISALVESSQR